MPEMSSNYLASLAGQIAKLSAFLGGFSATFLATLLGFGKSSKLMAFAIGLAVTSSVAFIVAVVAAVTLTGIYHPDAPASFRAWGASHQKFMIFGFYLDSLSLLGSLGISGWTRSRSMGWVTTIPAVLGAIAIIVITTKFA